MESRAIGTSYTDARIAEDMAIRREGGKTRARVRRVVSVPVSRVREGGGEEGRGWALGSWTVDGPRQAAPAFSSVKFNTT